MDGAPGARVPGALLVADGIPLLEDSDTEAEHGIPMALHGLLDDHGRIVTRKDRPWVVIVKSVLWSR